MLRNDMWKIFEVTGKIDAYLYCKDTAVENEEMKDTINIEEEQEISIQG